MDRPQFAECIKPVKTEILEVADSGPSCSYTLDKSQFVEYLEPKKTCTDLEVKEEVDEYSTSTSFTEFEEYLEPLKKEELEVKAEVENLDYAGFPGIKSERELVLEVPKELKQIKEEAEDHSGELDTDLRNGSEQTFSCRHCDFKTKEFDILIQHISRRQGDACPIFLTYRDYIPVQPANLRTHFTACYKLECSFACPHCNYTTTYSSHLESHILARHSVELPIACPDCKYTCTNCKPSSLKNHIRAVQSASLRWWGKARGNGGGVGEGEGERRRGGGRRGGTEEGWGKARGWVILGVLQGVGVGVAKP